MAICQHARLRRLVRRKPQRVVAMLQAWLATPKDPDVMRLCEPKS